MAADDDEHGWSAEERNNGLIINNDGEENHYALLLRHPVTGKMVSRAKYYAGMEYQTDPALLKERF